MALSYKDKFELINLDKMDQEDKQLWLDLKEKTNDFSDMDKEIEGMSAKKWFEELEIIAKSWDAIDKPAITKPRKETKKPAAKPAKPAAKPASKRKPKVEAKKAKLSPSDIENIEELLSTDADSSEADLVKIISEEWGTTKTEAQKWVKKRDYYLKGDKKTYSERTKEKKESRKKKSPKPSPAPKSEPAKDNRIAECKKDLEKAGYRVTNKTSKDGKPEKKKVERQDRTIIKDKVADTFTTITKEIKSEDEKKEYASSIKEVEEIKSYLVNIITAIDKIFADNNVESLRKIKKLLKELNPGK